MKKLLQTTIIVLAGLIALVFVGAGCVQDAITPCYISEEAAEWAGVPTKIFLPYTTLWDARRVANALNYEYDRLGLEYQYYWGITEGSIQRGEELKNTVFSPTGILAPLLIGAPVFAAGVYGVSKPKDRKRIVEREKNGNTVG